MEKKTNKTKLETFPIFEKISWKFNKNTLTRVFLHAEFISAMKTVTKSYGFHENARNNRKSFIFVNCLRFSLKLLSRLSLKVIKYLF